LRARAAAAIEPNADGVRLLAIGCAAFSCFALAPAPGRADDVRVRADLTLNFVDGKHDTGMSVDRLTFVPLPWGEVTASLGRTILHVEGLPPVSFRYGAAAAQSTQLSLASLTLRRAFPAGAFAGVGQTVINQSTSYAQSASADVARQSSRVTGLRFEAGIAHRAFGSTNLEYGFAVNPGMHGVERTLPRNAQGQFAAAERAVQIDTTLRFVHAFGRGALFYGIRYINYASRYDRRGTSTDGLLADRNVGFMPLAGYRFGF
jgi:hypothetical protein